MPFSDSSGKGRGGLLDSRVLHWVGRPSGIASIIWGFVYALVWATGQSFSTDYLRTGWQIVPFETLRDDPFGSVWYLHIQPPLWNLTLGVVGRWSPLPTAVSLQMLSMFLGVVLAGTLASLLARIGLQPRASVTVAAVATLNPTVLKLAFDPQYELVTGVALVLLLWVVSAPQSTKTVSTLVQVSVIGTGIVMTRSLFHPLWLVALLGPFSYAARGAVPGRKIAAAVLIPAIVIGGWTLKNEVLFGQPTLSSWTGMNLLRSVSPTFAHDDLERLAASDDISRIAVVGPFQSYDAYVGATSACKPEHDHPAVSQAIRSTPVRSVFDGSESFIANFNYECYLPIYKAAGEDARTLAVEYPGHWLSGRLWSTRAWFGARIDFATSPSPLMRTIDRVYAVARLDVPLPQISMAGWDGANALKPIARAPVSLVVLVCTLLVWGTGLQEVNRRLRHRSDGFPRGLVFVVASFVSGWAFVLGVVGELGEQARFRSMTDPFVVALGLAVGVHWIGEHFDRSWMFERAASNADGARSGGVSAPQLERSRRRTPAGRQRRVLAPVFLRR